MNRKSLLAAIALLILMAAAIFGLPRMTKGMQRGQMRHAVVVTATPAPEPDDMDYQAVD